MISPTKTQVLAASGLGLDDFEDDPPNPPRRAARLADAVQNPDIIDGVTATELFANTDPRGSLRELLTTRDGPIEPILHVYQVTAAPRSIRAWVYHRHQYDRLAFMNGHFEIVLYDIRPGSPTMNFLNVFRLGEERPYLLRIPPFVIHAVRNLSNEWSHFINFPTKTYDPKHPDKSRIPWNDPRIPYSFDAP